MSVFTINPLTDFRWSELVARHPRASVFHTPGWLAALQQTYGYEPLVLTTCSPDEPLNNGLVFCRISSWITGKRLVSLPFSDHCDLLLNSASEQEELLNYVCEHVVRDGYSYAEIRATAADPACARAANLRPNETFCLHKLSLEEPSHVLFHNLHRDCIQRKIRRAEREGLVYESGRSEDCLGRFYRLMLRTRRRHSLPPQPLSWFFNLLVSMGDALTIRLASKGNDPVAAILTLSHGTTVTFKYGCSDERFHHLGGTPFLLWKMIEESKNQGMHELDLGRSELKQAGLVQFKDRLGAVKTAVTYWRAQNATDRDAVHSLWRTRIAKEVFSRVPDSVLVASGRLLYRHIG